MDMITLIDIQNNIIWGFIYAGMIISVATLYIILYKLFTGD